MSKASWDPLSVSQTADAEIVSAAQKREIKNILKSYVGKYDSFSELIQNAMDAVDRRSQIEQPGSYDKRLWLTIDLRKPENSFTIVDNGIAFNEKEFESFLAPNISFKNDGGTRGNKGVGATYIGYGFNTLQFGTKGNGFDFQGQLIDGRNWVDDYKGNYTRPQIVPAKLDNDTFSTISRGSIFKIKFGGENTRPKDLTWYGATTAEQWLFLLLIKTPLGSISYIDEKSNSIKFEVTVIDTNGNITTKSDIDASYMYPHLQINTSINLKDVLVYQDNLVKANRDKDNLPPKFTMGNGLYEVFSSEDILQMRKSDVIFAELVETFQVEAYAYFTYSTSVWDAFNDSKAKLRKGYRVLRGGIQLANNRMPQGDLVPIPLTSNIGHQNQCHVVVHFKDADPDLGRKGFQPELKELAEKISLSIISRFQKWNKKLLKVDTGVKPDIEKELSVYEWVKAQEAHELSRPLIINNKKFFAPINEISITSEPQSEQDVIVLFNQLIAGGVIRGMKLLATSQKKQYDGVYKFHIKKPLENHVFHKEDNPLGVEEFHFNDEHISPPKILEYKYNLDALIREFENGDKNEKDIHLAICWEIGSEWNKSYQAMSYLDLDNLHQRDYHGLTHRLDSGTTRFHVIALKELIEYLNDVDSVQTYHKETYGENLFG